MSFRYHILLKSALLTTELIFAYVLFSENALSADKNDFQLKKQPEIQQVRPPKPVAIKLHRTAKGEYSWELSGGNADDIAATDRRLRKLLKVE